MLSRQALSANGVPVSAATLAAMSMVQTTCSDTPGLMRPDQRVMNGVRVPPSSTLYLPPLKGPEGWCAPSFSRTKSPLSP